MARIRSIKPEFWISDQVTECSLPARLMFIGLWSFCDDGGRMPYSPRRIKKQIFPADDITSESIQRMIDELSSNDLGKPLISIYEVDGKQYLQITGWAKHQRIDRPTYLYPDQNGVIPPNKGFGSKHARRVIDEGSTPESSRVDRSRVDRRGKEDSPSLTRRSRARDGANSFAADWPDNYRERFLSAYTHHHDVKGMLAALDHLAANPTIGFEDLIGRIKNYIDTKPDDRQFLNGKTYLEQERWNDKPAASNGNGRHRPTRGDRARELARQVEARERASETGGAAETLGGAELGGEDARLVSGRRDA